ncbi:portal protein [Gordonia phage Emalyn]|uniref:Portal protein n=1 Tax=Gordonia phage Emalyn TaxID=1821552 RepID=A0A142KBU0_9CAUD|nr:portal protein [Gordonia phage Emalyn]AMS03573.1 portal protein [Gordonia phage Emalyn]
MSSSYITLMNELNKHRNSNELTDRYYEGTRTTRPGFSIPPTIRRDVMDLVCGWPATTVDVLHERIDWRGWDTDAKYMKVLQQVYDDNELAYESELGHLDSLLYGVSFGVIGTGDKKIGEPEILATVESAKDMTGLYNRRKRRIEAAALKGYVNGEWLRGTLYEENQTTFYERATETSRWRVTGTDKHNLGRCPVVWFPNRARAGRRQGKSEVTKAVRAYTNMAVRTLMGMETNREFFSAPQRYALGAREDAFTDANGNPLPGWQALLGHFWNLERDEEWVEDHPDSKSEGIPQVGQFPTNPPGPYMQQIEGLSKMFAAEVGIPPSYLGFVTENPPSGDAIRALEARLVKRAERRVSGFNPGWVELGQLAVYLKTREIPSKGDMVTVWRDPGTPTAGADADRVVKLTSAGIMPKDSDVTREMVGLTPSQAKRVKRDLAKEQMMAILRGGDNGGSAESDGSREPAGADNPSGASGAQSGVEESAPA